MSGAALPPLLQAGPQRVEAIEPLSLNLSQPVSSIQVEFSGLKQIDPEVVFKDCGSLNDVTTVGGLVSEVSKIQQAFLKTGCFAAVYPQLSWSPHDGVLVHFNVKEARNSFSFGTSVNQSGNVAMEITARAPSLLRRYHSATFDGNITRDKDYEMQACYTVPRAFRTNALAWDAQLQLYNQKIHNMASSSYTEGAMGLRLKVSDAKDARHHITLETASRHLDLASNVDAMASVGVVMSPRQTWKTSFKYSCSHKKEALSRYLSRLGTLVAEVQGSTEIAHLNNEAPAFVKSEGQAITTFTFLRDWSLTCRTAVGGMAGLSAICRPIFRKQQPEVVQNDNWFNAGDFPIQDRFFLGGACGSSSVLNGFATRRVGPVSPRRFWRYPDLKPSTIPLRDGQPPSFDYLGGTLYSSVHVSLARRLRSLHNTAVSGLNPSIFVFGNAGLLGNPSSEFSMRNIKQQVRVAAGLGLSLPVGSMGALELLLCKPLQAAATDTTNTIQLGFRINTLSL